MDDAKVNARRTRSVLPSIIQVLCVAGLVTTAQASEKSKERSGPAIGMHDVDHYRRTRAETNCITKSDRNGRAYQYCNVKPVVRERTPIVKKSTAPRSKSVQTEKSYRSPASVEATQPSSKASPRPVAPTGSQPTSGGTPKGVQAAPPPTSPIGPAATHPSGLLPVRALIEPSEVPPREVPAYGIVAFSALPIGSETARYKFTCEAFKATLIPQSDLPPHTKLSEQMITFWPVRDKQKPQAIKMDCDYLVPSYDLKTGLDAIHDADPKNNYLAQRRGPFLIAWSPSESRYRGDSLVLIMDLSSIDEQESFMEVFRSWRHKITDDPSIWKKGFEVESVRRTVKEILDHYGESILKVVKPSS